MKKRILSLALAMVMLISLLPATTFAAAATSVKCVFYSPRRVIEPSLSNGQTTYVVLVDDTTTEDTTDKMPAVASTQPEDNYIKLSYKITDGVGTYTMYLKNFDTSAVKTNGGPFMNVNSGTTFNVEIVLDGINKIIGPYVAFSIKNKGSITITGNGSLEMASTGLASSSVFFKEAAGDLIIRDTTVKISGASGSGMSSGITVNGNITIDNSTVEGYNIKSGDFLRTASQSTSGLIAGEIKVINSTLIAFLTYGNNYLPLSTSASGKVTINNSNVHVAAGHAQNSRISRTAPYIEGTYSSQKISDLGYGHSSYETAANLWNNNLTPGASISAGTIRYIKLVHECVALADDGDCTTAVKCACGKVVVPAEAEHIAEEDDNNCATPTKCINCTVDVIPGFAHTPMDPVIENDTEDSYDSVVYCSVCDKEVSRETISKLCPHTNSTFLSQDDPNCTEDGAAHYYCSDCEENYDVVIPATGHSYTAGTPVPPTIYADGYTTYTCDTCGDTYKGDIVGKIQAIAIIGDTPYFSLKEAVDAAVDGDVIVLCRNQKVGEAVYIDTDITIDFNGCYYAIDVAYENAAMVIAEGATVTLKNSRPTLPSKFMVAYSNEDGICSMNFSRLIKNAGTLNVENLTLNGNNTFAEVTTCTIENTGDLYLGTGTVVNARTNTLISTGKVIKADDADVVAPSGFHFAKSGLLEEHDYEISTIAATVYDVSYTKYTCACGDTFSVRTGTHKLPSKAKNVHTGKRYGSLQEAIDEAENGQTVALTSGNKCIPTVVIPSGKTIIIDLNGTYCAVEREGVSRGAAMIIEEGAEVHLISSGATAKLKAEYISWELFDCVVNNKGTLTVDNVIINGNNLFNSGSYAVRNQNVGTLVMKDDSSISIRRDDPTIGETDDTGTIVDNTSINAPLATPEQLENITVKKEASVGNAVTLHPGAQFTYTLSITNNNAETISLNITEPLAKKVVYVNGCEDARDDKLCWTEKNIAPGETRTITYTVKNTYTIAQVRASETDILIENPAISIVGKSFTTSPKDIWVLETFNKEDRRKMEMAIDSLVTANLSVVNANNGPLYPIAMMYNVGFTVGPGLGYTDPVKILEAIYNDAGASGSGSTSGGGVEDVTDIGMNLLDRVAPTLYGGTAVPPEKDILFRGARATSVTAADLVSGDVLLVNKDNETKAYIYDGTYLVECGKTKITTNITPSSVLSTLPSADKWVVLRLSINLNITFALNEGEYFNDADKNGYTDLEKQLIATAETYLLRGDRTQYTDDMTGTSLFRWETTIKQPEDYTVDQYGYTNCAAFTYDVHWATYGYAARANSLNLNTTSNLASVSAAGWNAETLKGTYKSTVFYYEPPTEKVGEQYVSTLTDAEKAALKQQICSLLRPGDIICIRRTSGSGHAMLYVGNGTIIHSSGSSYSQASKMETHEASIRFRMVEDLFDANIYAHTSCVYNLKSFSIVRLQNLKSNPTASENTLNRVNNMQGIIGEKVVSTAMGKTVNCGDEITYTFHVFNTNKTAKEIAIRDVLSEHVTFVSATNSGMVDGSNISWNITVPAETRVSVSYTVKVKDGVAAYTEINGHNATINGVVHKCNHTYVVNTLTAEQQQALVAAVETVKGMDVSALNSVEIAELIYKTAFGVDDLFGEEVTNFSMLLDGGNNQVNSTSIVKGKDNVGVFNDAWYWESSNRSTVALMNYNTSKPAMMVAPGLYGGALVMNSTYNKNNRDETFTRFTGMSGGALRSRLFWEKDLVIGDLFMMKGSTTEVMYLYIGNDTFVTLASNFAEKSVAERFQYAPHSTWKKYAVLRPSFQLDI